MDMLQWALWKSHRDPSLLENFYWIHTRLKTKPQVFSSILLLLHTLAPKHLSHFISLVPIQPLGSSQPGLTIPKAPYTQSHFWACSYHRWCRCYTKTACEEGSFWTILVDTPALTYIVDWTGRKRCSFVTCLPRRWSDCTLAQKQPLHLLHTILLYLQWPPYHSKLLSDLGLLHKTSPSHHNFILIPSPLKLIQFTCHLIIAL